MKDAYSSLYRVCIYIARCSEPNKRPRLIFIVKEMIFRSTWLSFSLSTTCVSDVQVVESKKKVRVLFSLINYCASPCAYSLASLLSVSFTLFIYLKKKKGGRGKSFSAFYYNFLLPFSPFSSASFLPVPTHFGGCEPLMNAKLLLLLLRPPVSYLCPLDRTRDYTRKK